MPMNIVWQTLVGPTENETLAKDMEIQHAAKANQRISLVVHQSTRQKLGSIPIGRICVKCK